MSSAGQFYCRATDNPAGHVGGLERFRRSEEIWPAVEYLAEARLVARSAINLASVAELVEASREFDSVANPDIDRLILHRSPDFARACSRQNFLIWGAHRLNALDKQESEERFAAAIPIVLGTERAYGHLPREGDVGVVNETRKSLMDAVRTVALFTGRGRHLKQGTTKLPHLGVLPNSEADPVRDILFDDWLALLDLGEKALVPLCKAEQLPLHLMGAATIKAVAKGRTGKDARDMLATVLHKPLLVA